LIEFHLDTGTGVSPYMQIIKQVKRALRLGILNNGDQLPTVKEVVSKLVINPNTVLKAYRQLEAMGLAQAKPGIGTFITTSAPEVSPSSFLPLKIELQKWIDKAIKNGADLEIIEAIFQECLRQSDVEETA
jgi:GntR family transcriptional regulator